jgi:hypothetical protein
MMLFELPARHDLVDVRFDARGALFACRPEEGDERGGDAGGEEPYAFASRAAWECCDGAGEGRSEAAIEEPREEH